MFEQFDVIVVGGGPSGASTGLSLSRLGRTVAVLDGPTRVTFRLGESLAPAVVRLLSRIGLDATAVLKPHSPSWRLDSAWGASALRQTDLTFHPLGCAWHVNRSVFDAALLLAAQDSGVQVYRNVRVRRCAAIGDGSWRVELADGRTLTARWVVDATGRPAAVARPLGAVRRRTSRLLALGTQVHAAQNLGEMHSLVETCPSGWWFAATMPDRQVAIAFFSDFHLLPRSQRERTLFWRSRLLETTHLRRRTVDLGDSRLLVVAADSTRLEPVVGKRWLAVGDAAYAMDPLSSFGVCNALDTGSRAASAIHMSLRGDDTLLARYEGYVRHCFEDSERFRVSFYAMERRFANEPFWARRHRAVTN